MTVISSYIQGSKVWIASDSIGSDDDLKYDFGSKLIKVNDYLVGFSASYRVADLINECQTFPEQISNLDEARLFRDELKRIVIDSGALERSTSDEMLGHPIAIILATSSGIYVIESDYQIHHFGKEFDYYSVGSGASVATSALFFAANTQCDGENAVYLSVDSAIIHTPTCGGEVYLDSVSMKTLSIVHS